VDRNNAPASEKVPFGSAISDASLTNAHLYFDPHQSNDDRILGVPGRIWTPMDALTLFGVSAVTAMLICYALEDRSRTFILAFAASCVLGSAYGFLQGAWPFGLLEAIWSLVALRRWLRRRAAPV